jgi:predicted secreted protein
MDMFRKIATAAFLGLFLVVPAVANGSLEVRLPGNPSTGYQWRLNAETSSGLERVDVESLGYGEPESDLMGAPAPFVFRVVCVSAGAVMLRFDYVSPSGLTISKTAEHEMDCAP